MTKLVSITSSSYPGAEFTVNGQYPAGSLPTMMSIEIPRSFVSVHSGDAYISTLVPSLNTDTVPLEIKKPDQPHGLLKIESNPDGADILIDGFPTGKTTPQTFSEVSAGLHRVSLSKPGYYPSDEIITVPITSDNTSVQRLFYPLENYGEGSIVVDSMPQGGAYLLKRLGNRRGDPPYLRPPEDRILRGGRQPGGKAMDRPGRADPGQGLQGRCGLQ